MASSGNRRGGRGGSGSFKIPAFPKFEVLSDSEADGEQLPEAKKGKIGGEATGADLGKTKRPARGGAKAPPAKEPPVDDVLNFNGNDEIVGPSDMVNDDQDVDVHNEDEESEEEEEESEEEVRSELSSEEWTPSLEDAWKASPKKSGKKTAGKPAAETSVVVSPSPTIPVVATRANQPAKKARGAKNAPKPVVQALPMPVPMVPTIPQLPPTTPPLATALASFNLPALREQTLSLYNFLNTISQMQLLTLPPPPLPTLPAPVPLLPPLPPAPLPLPPSAGPIKIGTGTKRGNQGRAAPTTASPRGRGASTRGGSRGGRPSRPAATFAAISSALPANPKESIVVQAVGNKVGMPYEGPAVIPEQVAANIFTIRSSGAARSPILFVLAPNPASDPPSINFSHLQRVIMAAGGTVLANLNELPPGRINLTVAPALSFCIAMAPNQTPEFLFGVAYGAKCIYPTWIYECASSGRLLDHADYVLPAGRDLFGKELYQHRRRMIFGGRKIVVIAPTSSMSLANRLTKVLFAAGATASCLKSSCDDPVDEEDQRRVADASFILLADAPPLPTAPIVHLAQANQKIFATYDWLAQSLLFGRVIEPTCNAAFTWRPSGGFVGTGATVKMEPGGAASF